MRGTGLFGDTTRSLWIAAVVIVSPALGSAQPAVPPPPVEDYGCVGNPVTSRPADHPFLPPASWLNTPNFGRYSGTMAADGTWWASSVFGVHGFLWYQSVGSRFDVTGYAPNLDWSWGPMPADFPAASHDFNDDSVALVPADSRATTGAMKAFGTRPVLDNTLDLVTGRTLLREKDLDLQFGGTSFRLMRTFSTTEADEILFRSTEGSVPSGKREATWDWNGWGWMSNISPILLIDAAYHDILGQGDNSTPTDHKPPRRRSWFVLDAHRSIPFDRDPATGNYSSPPQFDARLIPVGGTWQVDTSPEGGHWQVFPTSYKVVLRDALTYTVQVQPDELPYMSCPDELGNPVLASAAPDLNRPGQLARPGLGGRGAPRYGLTTQIDDNYGHRVEITLAPRRRWTVVDRGPVYPQAEPKELVVENYHERGQVRVVKLIRNAGETNQEVVWTLLFQYRAFWGVPQAVAPGSPPLWFGAQWNLYRDNQPMNGEFGALFSPTAVHRVYAYKGFSDTLSTFINTQPEWDWVDGATPGWTLPGKMFTRAQPERISIEQTDAIETAYPPEWAYKVSYLYTEAKGFSDGQRECVQDIHTVDMSGRRNVADGLLWGTHTMPHNRPYLVKSEVQQKSGVNGQSPLRNRRLYTYGPIWQYGNEGLDGQRTELHVVFDEEGIRKVLKEMETAHAENVDANLDNGTACVASWGFPPDTYSDSVTYEFDSVPFTEYSILRSMGMSYAYREDNTLRTRSPWYHAAYKLGPARHGFREPNGFFQTMAQQHLGLSEALQRRLCYVLKSPARTVLLRRATGSSSEACYRVYTFLVAPEGVPLVKPFEGSVLDPCDLPALAYGVSFNHPAIPQRSIFHYPYKWLAFDDDFKLIKPSAQSWADIGISERRTVTTVDLNEPRWVTVVDQYSDLMEGPGSPYNLFMEFLGDQPPVGTHIERRVLLMNAAGYVLNDRRWDMSKDPLGVLTSQGGLGESTLYDSQNRILERRSAGWSALPVSPSSERQDKGLIYAFNYAGEHDTKPNKIGVKWGTNGTPLWLTEMAYDTNRPDLVTQETAYPASNVTAITNTLIDTASYRYGTVSLTGKMTLKPAVTIAAGGTTVYRAFEADIFLPDGRLRWKARGQVANTSSARVPGDRIKLDYMIYADDFPADTLPTSVFSSKLLASVEDVEEGSRITLPGSGVPYVIPSITGRFDWLSRYVEPVAGVSGTAVAANRTTEYVYNEFGICRVYYPDGRRQYVFTNVQSDEVVQRLYDDVVVGTNQPFRALKAGRIVRLAPSGAILDTKTVEWNGSQSEPTGTDDYTVVFTQTASTDDSGRPNSLTRTVVGSNDTINASVVYGVGGLVERSTSAEGKVTRNEHDPRGRVTRVFMGTSDTDRYWTDGITDNLATDNMVMAERRTYGVGLTDALQLKETRRYRNRHPLQYQDESSFSTNDGALMTEERHFDRAMRLAKVRVLSETRALVRETVTWHDNLDREIISATYIAPGVPSSIDPSGPNGVFYNNSGSPTSAIIRSILSKTVLPVRLSQTIYNARGDVEERRTYAPGLNRTNQYLVERHYYNNDGKAAVDETPGGGITRRWYDAEGRLARLSVYAGSIEANRTVYQYDYYGREIQAATSERMHDAAASPAELNGTNSVTSYRFNWHDQSGRVTATADVGTGHTGDQFRNAATVPVRPEQAPVWDATTGTYTQFTAGTAIINLTEYDTQGRVIGLRSNAGVLTRSYYNKLGQLVLETQNAGAPAGVSRSTAYRYNKGRLVAIAAVLPGHVVQPTGEIDWTPAPTLQITTVEYGADVVAYSSSTPGGTIFADPTKVARVYYPAIAGTVPAPDLTFKYYADGLLARRADARGIEFTHFYDGRGNRTASVVSARPFYDPFQRQLVDVSEETYFMYNALDQLTSVTAATSGEGIFGSKNENVFEYNQFGNILSETQYHGDKDNVDGSVINYVWQFSPAGAQNRSRLAGIVYPKWSFNTSDTLRLDIGYGDPASVSDKLGYVRSIKNAFTTLASYDYTGSGRRVNTSMENAAYKQSFGGGAAAYPGLDRFGRIADLDWKIGTTRIQRYRYGYDAAGNVKFERLDNYYGGLPVENKQSQLFLYDQLDRLISAERGQLDADNTAIARSFTAPTARLVEWGYDNLDNLTGNASQPFGIKTQQYNNTLNQFSPVGDIKHTVDAQNRILKVVRTGEYFPSVVPTSGDVVYDRAGNLVSDSQYFYQYDAWNRLIQVSDLGSVVFTPTGEIADGSPGLWRIHYTYDGLGRQIRKQQPWTDSAGDPYVRSIHYFYDGARRIQEVLVDPLSSAAPVKLKDDKCEPPKPSDEKVTVTLDRSYVYGPGDRLGLDEFVCQIDSNSGRTYFLQNIAGDVTALVRGNAVVCQYTFDATGVLILADHMQAQVANRVGHKGLFFDRIDGHPMSLQLLPNAKGLYQNRNRMYSPMLGRFIQKDPNASGLPVMANSVKWGSGAQLASLLPYDAQSQYGDGMNLYGYLGSNPYLRRDSLGLSWDPFDMVDEYMVESAAAQAAFLSRVIGGFNAAAHIAWQIAQLHPAIGLAAAAYNLATGQGDLWDILAVAGPAAKLIGKAIGTYAKVSAQYAAKGLNGLCRACISEGTLVETACGPVPIEALQPGDLVLAVPDGDPLGTPQFMPITAIYHNQSTELLTVAFTDGSTISLTAAHEVFTATGGWGLAEDVRTGDVMLDKQGELRVVDRVVRAFAPVRTYNLTVAGSHTFFADGILVHNCDGPIRFGANANQEYHTFRHIEALGLSREAVQAEVIGDLASKAAKMQPGQTISGIILVNGQRLQYNAHRLENGTINIGRISEISQGSRFFGP